MNAIERGELCRIAEQAIRHGMGNLSNVPGLIKKIIETEAWKERAIGPGRVVKLSSLCELITAKPLDGWGEDPKKVEALLKGDAEAIAMWRKAMKHQGPNKLCNNITELQAVTGTSQSYTLDRLERDAPELFNEVKQGELSAHAAAIKAGFRTKTLTIPLDAQRAARTIRKHFSDDQVKELIRQLRM